MLGSTAVFARRYDRTPFLSVGMSWLLLGIPVLVTGYVYLLRQRRKFALRFADLSIIKQGLGKRTGIRRHIPPRCTGCRFVCW